jgi:hypothetical protein
MPFKRIQTSTQEVQLIQDNIATALQPLEAMPMVGGNLVTADLVTGQDNLVRHGLGRKPKLYLIGNLNVDATVWSPVATSMNSSSDATFINLRCSADCTVSVWVA